MEKNPAALSPYVLSQASAQLVEEDRGGIQLTQVYLETSD